MHQSGALRADPAADAASLLLRLGFIVLFVVLPTAALLSRRGAVVLMPVGAILLILAALVDPAAKPFGARLRDVLRSPLAWTVLGVGIWAAVSLVWTPSPVSALDRVANLSGLLIIAVGAVAALPWRLRAPTLYLMPLGVMAAAAVACVIMLDSRFGWRLLSVSADGTTVQRGLATLTLMSVPGAGWLLSRGRVLDACLLGIALLAVSVTGQDPVMAGCVMGGAVAFGALRVRPALAGLFVGLALALIVAVAVLPLLVKAWQGQTVAGMPLMPLLSGSFLRRLGRLLTGYGIETTPRMAAGNYFQPVGPTYAAGIWFDLGIVAAGLIGSALVLATRRALQISPALGAAMVAWTVVATGQGVFLPGTFQAWWSSSLIASVIGIVAIGRGQGRTRRPGIGLFNRAPAPAQP